jgi:hypothetical protein
MTQLSFLHDKKKWDLVHREDLLWQLAQEIKRLEDERAHTELCHLKVRFFKDDEEITRIYSIAIALDWIVNDIYYNEKANWSEANKLTVELI